jgi:hypothetical protein
MCNVAIAVDEARRVDVHILPIVEVDRPLDQWGDESLGIIAAFARADDAIVWLSA